MATPFDRGSRWRLAALALSMLLPSLGTSIANVALPSLETAFAASFNEVQWVVISYLLAVTTLIVGVGRLGDQIGRRDLLLAGIGIFAIASAGAALAPTLGVLIAARVVQGLGAAIMMALSVASVSDIMPKERIGGAMGLLGSVSAIGTVLGPSLGGALLSWASWPALFLVMAGAGTITLLVGLWVLPAGPARQQNATSFDLFGMAILIVSLGAYALSTTWDGPCFWIQNAGLATIAIAGAIAFVLVEKRSASPLVPIAILQERRLAAGLVSLGLVSTIMMATLVVGPFYLSHGLDLEPVRMGLVMSVGPGVAALTGLPAGRLVDRNGSRRVILIGLIGVTSGSAFMMFMPAWMGTGGYVVSLVIITAGYALFQAANNTAIMAGAQHDQKGLISGLMGLARNLGLITGASAMGAVFAAGLHGVWLPGLPAGPQTGLMLTFAVATLLAGIAIAITR